MEHFVASNAENVSIETSLHIGGECFQYEPLDNDILSDDIHRVRLDVAKESMHPSALHCVLRQQQNSVTLNAFKSRMPPHRFRKKAANDRVMSLALIAYDANGENVERQRGACLKSSLFHYANDYFPCVGVLFSGTIFKLHPCVWGNNSAKHEQSDAMGAYDPC